MGAFYEKDEMNPFWYNYCGKMCMTVLCRTIVRRNDLFGYEMPPKVYVELLGAFTFNPIFLIFLYVVFHIFEI